MRTGYARDGMRIHHSSSPTRITTTFESGSAGQKEGDMGRAMDAVKSIAVGKQATLRTENTSANHIVAFQEDVRELRDLHTQGVVEILFEHSESVTSHHYIDFVTYRRR